MRDLLLLLIMALVAGYFAFDIFRTLRSGRANTWMDGTATREGQPRKYWRYIYQAWAGLAFFVAAFLWAWLWPETMK
jgi:hypothetical protein